MKSKSIKFLMLPLVLLLLGGVISSCRLAGESKDITSFEDESRRLESEVKELKVTLSEKQSLQSIASEALNLGMVKASTFWFVPSSDSLASR